jgi:hypothetical protein
MTDPQEDDMTAQVDSTTKKTMTFTIREVRAHSTGETNGRTWTKYLVFTTDGEILGTFEPDWQLFTHDTVSCEVAEKIVNGKPYLSVGKPPSGSPTSPKSSRARPAPLPPTQTYFTARDFEEALGPIKAGIMQIMERLDTIAAALEPQQPDETEV